MLVLVARWCFNAVVFFFLFLEFFYYYLYEAGIHFVAFMWQKSQEMLEFDAISEVAVDEMEDKRQ